MNFQIKNTSAIKTLIGTLEIGEYVSKKSTLSICLQPITTNLALDFSIDPLVLNFFRTTHSQPILLQPGRRSVRDQVSLVLRKLISSLITSFQKGVSIDLMVSP